MFSTKRVYLDAAAAMPILPEAAHAFMRANTKYGNPSSPHEEGRQAHIILEDARTKIARLIECKADDIIFTSGATEANNLALAGVLVDAKAKNGGAHVLYMESAHASIVETIRALEKQGIESDSIPATNGRIDIETLKRKVRPETVLISMDAVCGETGTIWDSRAVKGALPDILLHVDASQAPLTQKFTRSHFASDLLVLDASKVGGVRGIGCLIAHRTIPLAPLLHGGGQERALRPGTQSPALTASFAEALDACRVSREAFVVRAKAMKEQMRAQIQMIPNFHINEGSEVVPHILNFSLIGRDTDYLVALLDEAGFAVSTRSACETDSAAGSRAVFALTKDEERARSTLRVSFLPTTTSRDIRRFGQALIKAVQFVDNARL